MVASAEAHPVGGAQSGGWRAGLPMLGVFAAAVVAMLAVSVLLVVVGNPSLLVDGGLAPWFLVAVLVVPALTGAVVAVAGTALAGGGARAGRVRRELAVHWSWRAVGTGVAIGGGGLLLTVPAVVLWASWVGADRATSAVGELVAGQYLDPVAAVALFLVVWLVAPLGEEVLFRGVLWRALEHGRWDRWVIFAATSVVFSVAHLELLRAPLLLVLSVPVGLARAVTGNVLASVAAHQVNNFLPAVGLLLATTGSLPA